MSCRSGTVSSAKGKGSYGRYGLRDIQTGLPLRPGLDDLGLSLCLKGAPDNPDGRKPSRIKGRPLRCWTGFALPGCHRMAPVYPVVVRLWCLLRGAIRVNCVRLVRRKRSQLLLGPFMAR
jgi:hypothetical protein